MKSQTEQISEMIDILCGLRLGLQGVDNEYIISGLTFLCQYNHNGGTNQNKIYQYGVPAIMAQPGNGKGKKHENKT